MFVCVYVCVVYACLCVCIVYACLFWFMWVTVVSFSVTLHCISLRQGLLLVLWLTLSGRLPDSDLPGLLISDSPMLGLQARVAMSHFYTDTGDLNSGPSVSVASTLLTESFLQPPKLYSSILKRRLRLCIPSLKAVLVIQLQHPSFIHCTTSNVLGHFASGTIHWKLKSLHV